MHVRRIVDFRDRGLRADYKDAIKRLNEDWIKKHFVMEEADHRVFDHPAEEIISQSGHILFALLGKAFVGTCTLIKSHHDGFDFELAKMGVAPTFRRNGIGYELAVAALQEARGRGARKVILESNTVLAPAIKLYKKLGFAEFDGDASPYDRANIQMQTEL